MSYFKGLKLTKKGEQLQAKINGNLAEILTFTKAKVGSGTITSEDEIRFLTDLKESWGNAVISKCELQGEDKTQVAIELQFNNAELRENKIFREIGLYARGNGNEEILYAYANAGNQYDYIPLMKDSPHSFIVTIYFYIATGTKIDANIDLNSYISLKKFNEEMAKKVNKSDRASETEYGLVKYGTDENTALEGNKMSEITGKNYGGLLNKTGRKEAGKTYFDNNTKKLYLCKNDNYDISANVNNYIAMDNNSILDRLENFIKVKNNKIFTIGNICIETINCTPNTVGIRTVNVESNFKNIFSIFLTGYITEGQTEEHLMRQVVHDYYSKIVATKQVKLYASGNQSLELTIIGTI